MNDYIIFNFVILSEKSTFVNLDSQNSFDINWSNFLSVENIDDIVLCLIKASFIKASYPTFNILNFVL